MEEILDANKSRNTDFKNTQLESKNTFKNDFTSNIEPTVLDQETAGKL